jgi:hypothetical protein
MKRRRAVPSSESLASASIAAAVKFDEAAMHGLFRHHLLEHPRAGGG